MNRTIVLGASPNPSRYSNKAVIQLDQKGHEVFPLGIREGAIGDIDIILDTPEISYVHTITLYLGAQHQKAYYDYILGLKPRRIIFNPGAENEELAVMARQQGIKAENACTLVLLSTDQY